MNTDEEQRMIEVVHAYVRALNSGDLEAIMELYAEDATVEDPVGSPPKIGQDAIREFYAIATSMKLVVELEGDIRVAGRACAFPFSVTIVQEAESTTIHPIDVFDFDEVGAISHMRAYFGAPNIHH